MYPNFISLENEATVIRAFESLFVPGLLQTPDHARAVYSAAQPDRPTFEIKRLTDARMKRQQILNRADPPDLHVIITEDRIGPVADRAGHSVRVLGQAGRGLADVRTSVSGEVVQDDVGTGGRAGADVWVGTGATMGPTIAELV